MHVLVVLLLLLFFFLLRSGRLGLWCWSDDIPGRDGQDGHVGADVVVDAWCEAPQDGLEDGDALLELLMLDGEGKGLSEEAYVSDLSRSREGERKRGDATAEARPWAAPSGTAPARRV